MIVRPLSRQLWRGFFTGNLIVWDTASSVQVSAYIQKAFERDVRASCAVSGSRDSIPLCVQSWPSLQFSSDETVAAKAGKDTVQVFSTDTWATLGTCRAERVSHFALSPGPAPHSIAVFVPEVKGTPAFLSLYTLPNLEAAVSRKSFFNANRVSGPPCSGLAHVHLC